MMAWPRRVFGVLGVCLLFWAAPSRAADGVVRVTIASGAADARGLEAVFSELLERLRVSLDMTRVSALDSTAFVPPATVPPELLALVWVDLTRPGAATLYLLDVDTDRVVLRKIRREPGGDELVQEELGHILQTSVEGLLAGEPVGVPRREVLPLLDAATSASAPAQTERSEPPRPAKPLAPPARAELAPTNEAPPVPSGLRAHALLLYSAGLLGSGAPLAHGPELGLLAHTSGPLEPGLWLGLQLRLPVQLSTGPVSARFSQLAPRALFTATLLGNAERALRFGLGAGVDVVRVETSSEPDLDVFVQAPSTRAFLIGRAALLFDWRLAGALRLAAALGVDADGSDARYVFRSRSGERVLLEPYALRPAAGLGIATP